MNTKKYVELSQVKDLLDAKIEGCLVCIKRAKEEKRYKDVEKYNGLAFVFFELGCEIEKLAKDCEDENCERIEV